LTEQTKALLQRRATDLTYSAAALRAEAIGLHYDYDDLPVLEDRAMALRDIGFSVYTPEGLLIASGPSEEEWAAREAERQRFYLEQVEQAVEEAHTLAFSFRTLSAEVLALHFAGRPDRRIWRAIVSLVPLATRMEAQRIGRAMIDREEEEWLEQQREERAREGY